MDLMRQLEAEHKRLWDQLSPARPEMVAASDCDPALLSGWTDRDISLWDVSAIGGKPGLEEILVALCRRRKNWEKISYLRFPKETVSSAGLSLTASNGKTGSQRVDTSNTHFEIKGITGKELCTLLFNVCAGAFETGVFTKKQFDDILLAAYERVATRPFVQTATSQISTESLSSTGTKAPEVIEEEAPGTEDIEHVPTKPNSSTAPE
ncbi:MAG: hypothetical protein ACYC0O_12385 [Desulfurivibrionaceae bacterium]